MGREARRVDKNLKEPIGEAFWGYLLDSIDCRSCGGTGKFGDGDGDYCVVCEGEGKVHPTVNLPAYPVDETPFWFKVPRLADGFGWQMWETTTEGSPMSPIFDTPEELAHWLTETGASAFGGMTASYEQWLGMIKGCGSAPSAVVIGGQIRSGVDVFGTQEKSTD